MLARVFRYHDWIVRLHFYLGFVGGAHDELGLRACLRPFLMLWGLKRRPGPGDAFRVAR